MSEPDTEKQRMQKLLAVQLRKARKRLGLTQEELAAGLGITPGYVSSIEQGNRNPSFEFLFKLSRKYNVAPNFLVGGTTIFIEKGELLEETEPPTPEEVGTEAGFLWLFRHIPMFRHTLIGYGCKAFADNESTILGMIKDLKKKQGKIKSKDKKELK